MKKSISNIINSPIFICWSPFLFYLSRELTTRRDLHLFHLNYSFDEWGDGIEVLFLYATYFVVLFFITKKYDEHIKKIIDQKKQILLHSAALSLLIILASVLVHEGFDLILKLGIIWFLAIIQYLLSDLRVKK